MGGTKLPENIEKQRRRTSLSTTGIKDTSTVTYSGAYAAANVDNSFNLEQFKNDVRIAVTSMTEDTMEFDLIGIDPAIANALRRILISEVPTMAIEHVYIVNNTSIIQDEVLSHRLGLVPIRADPRLFSFKAKDAKASETNTIVMELKVKCTDRVKDGSVLSSCLQWLPEGSKLPPDTEEKFTSFLGSQKELLVKNGVSESDAHISPVHDDILLAKLATHQEIELECHAVKGLGKTHAKWSPVSTASYRLLPKIEFSRPVKGAEAEELRGRCPMKVFDIDDIEDIATVARPRDCTLCRECLREGAAKDAVRLHQVKEHFIFSIESTGALPPAVLVTEALGVLAEKCQGVLESL
mmetsp:Transcript_5010/g.18184  ORF Transcript_5010/g.18184 Transcript_5010/m.18184 type:complete len:353 (-) Transcript_5010:806-1864(-)